MRRHLATIGSRSGRLWDRMVEGRGGSQSTMAQRSAHGLIHEGVQAGRKLVDHHSQSKQVRPKIDGLAEHLLGRCKPASRRSHRSAELRTAAVSIRARPKSRILTRPLGVLTTFSGLMSRWMTPAAWAAARHGPAGRRSTRPERSAEGRRRARCAAVRQAHIRTRGTGCRRFPRGHRRWRFRARKGRRGTASSRSRSRRSRITTHLGGRALSATRRASRVSSAR